MLSHSNFPGATIMGRPTAKLGTKARKRRRQIVLDSLESRVLLSYTFSLVGQTATVSPVAATGGPFLVDEVVVAGNPLLEWSQDNGATFSTDWGGVPARLSPRTRLRPSTSRRPPARVRRSRSATCRPSASNIFATFNLGPPSSAGE